MCFYLAGVQNRQGWKYNGVLWRWAGDYNCNLDEVILQRTWFIKWNAVSFTDIQVKELDKRASGQAFEVILSPTAPEAKGDFPLSTPKKKEVSLDEIQKKLEAAEERRKVNMDTRTVPGQARWLFNYELHVGMVMHSPL